MVTKIKGVLGQITTCIEVGEHSAAMRAVLHFTVLFDQFLCRNKHYLFEHEVVSLNICMKEMLGFMEDKNYRGLMETIQSTFINLLDDWDFNHKIYN
ncbi:hypothetical protein Dtox_0664 [Desulfofarcimen acetoxidans DSM 771]|uniref:Uncharacterized protein n=1 Tax=Desulfofarcimen acetoxidans (strain ATCC 49208 / DSM 771 / KCTC 5769 / VKM B-1644 / 5575) TaxID=485916 RepID=C8W1D4_DESAS|nr:hypothetical protein [Desulfofarcimen acetoxidans]ACV61579.1 hypothetical protein Dtox_0664 [Desulfofarcimen acetoxidans DSM 771]